MRCERLAVMNSLSFKVLVAYLTGVILSILLIALGLVVLLTYGGEAVDRRVTSQAGKLGASLQWDAKASTVSVAAHDQQTDWIYRSFADEMAYRVFDASGKVVLHSAAGARFWLGAETTADHLGAGRFSFERDGVRIHVATALARRDGQTWFVQYALSARAAQFFQDELALPFMKRGIVLFSLILLVVFGTITFVTIGRTFRPLRELSASAASISPRSLNERLPLAGVPAEVVPLVNGFNSALARLEHGFRVQQEFLASAAHELKTPLALIRLQVERTQSGADKKSLLGDISHMTRQVQQLLLLAEASDVQNYHFEPVAVMDVAEEVTEYLQPLMQSADVRVASSSGSVRPTWSADRSALFTLLKNLLENAIQHSPRGSVLSLDADLMSVNVRDHGPGADDEQISRMFTRFWRGEHRRDEGAGLGLSICLEIARAHGWTLSAQRADPGLRFVLSRPCDRGPTEEGKST
jgi:signal transduction histidine kinase